MESFHSLHQKIIQCTRCPRLRTHCATVAKKKRKAYQQETYWGRPVPGFGDFKAQLWIVGLAPGAHGANRTGRVFTGDSSGDWLYRALYENGWSSQETSRDAQDNLLLNNVYISCVCRCAPPQNKPLPSEILNCAPYLRSEWELLKFPPLILTLGKTAFESVRTLLTEHYRLAKKPTWTFKHLALYSINGTEVLASYHPSRQNTATKKLTPHMWDAVFKKSSQLLENHALGKN